MYQDYQDRDYIIDRPKKEAKTRAGILDGAIDSMEFIDNQPSNFRTRNVVRMYYRVKGVNGENVLLHRDYTRSLNELSNLYALIKEITGKKPSWGYNLKALIGLKVKLEVIIVEKENGKYSNIVDVKAGNSETTSTLQLISKRKKIQSVGDVDIDKKDSEVEETENEYEDDYENDEEMEDEFENDDYDQDEDID